MERLFRSHCKFEKLHKLIMKKYEDKEKSLIFYVLMSPMFLSFIYQKR